MSTLTIDYSGHTLQFRLINTGGVAQSETVKAGSYFASRITVALIAGDIMPGALYPLLVSLTHNAWEGLIVVDPTLEMLPELTSYEITQATDEGEIYRITVGYKVYLTKQTAQYKVTP